MAPLFTKPLRVRDIQLRFFPIIWPRTAGEYLEFCTRAPRRVRSASERIICWRQRAIKTHQISGFHPRIVLGLVPLDSTTRSYLSGGAGAIYALFIPLLFWYLAWQSGGKLRKSNTLLGLGFFVLFAGRVIHAIRYSMAEILFGGSISIPGIVAPGLIIIGLIIIMTGLEWGQAG